jgi:hypothetical protein
MRRRVGVDAGDMYAARLQLDHEEDEVPFKTGQREHFDGKEVGSGEAGLVCEQEHLPWRALTPLGGRVDPVVLQDPLHRVPGDFVTEVGQRTLDACVAPLRILARHPRHEVRRSLGASSGGLAVVEDCRRTSGRATSGTSGGSCPG